MAWVVEAMSAPLPRDCGPYEVQAEISTATAAGSATNRKMFMGASMSERQAPRLPNHFSLRTGLGRHSLMGLTALTAGATKQKALRRRRALSALYD